MGRLAKTILGVMAVLLVLGGLAWFNRTKILLKGIEILAERRTPVGPNRPIEWSTGSDPRGRAPADRPPNIVLILADDLGWNDLTFNGGGVADGTVPTPHIDSIAAAGVNFVNGYAANGTCAPSRAAIMSGRYGTRFGFEFTPTPPGMMQLVSMMSKDQPGRLRQGILIPDVKAVPYDQMGMPPSEITIAELLKPQGYHTVHIGKWHLGRTNGMAPQDQGFDESLLMASGLYLPKDDPNVVNSMQKFDPIDKFLWHALLYAASFNGGARLRARKIPDRLLHRRSGEGDRGEQGSALLPLPRPLGAPYAAPGDESRLRRVAADQLHRERVYAAMIRALDRGVGQVLDALKANGLEDNTLVIFTSDNGGAGYIGLADVNDPFRGWKITLFEGGIHVPFFIKWPARIEAGQTRTDPVHHFDIFATAAAAAGAPLPTDRKMDGKDLVAYVNGETGPPHDALFWRSGASQSALVKGWKLDVSDPPDGDSPRREWLFDMRSDPTEQHDLSKERPDKLAELRAALAAHNAEQAEPAWPAQAVMPINLDKDLSIPDAPDDEYIYWSN